MAYDVIKLDKQDRIAVLTLNRPEKLNALSHDLLEEFVDALDDVQGDQDISVLV